jgi:hypothetical protein
MTLTPRVSFGEFKNKTEQMQDNSRMVVTGFEIINTGGGPVMSSGGEMVRQVNNIISRDYGIQAIAYNFQDKNESDIINRIRQNKSSFPVRYILVCYAETKPQHIPYVKGTIITISYHIGVYDTVSGKMIHSASQSDVFYAGQDNNLVSDSQNALNVCLRDGSKIKTIIREIFDNL